MAKKQGIGLQPILGRADNTLVQGAYRAAVANKPVDMRQQFQNTAIVHGQMLKNISANFASVIEGEKLSNQERDDVLGKAYDMFEDGTLTDGLLESRLGELQGFKDEWKSIPKGKKGEGERSKWKGKVNRYLSDQKGIIETMVTAGKLTKAGELHDMSVRDSNAITSIANLLSGTDDATASATAKEINNGDGTTSFEITPKAGGSYTITSDELKKMLPIKYHASAEKLTTINTGLIRDGATTNFTYGDEEKLNVSNDVVNFINGQGENKEAAYRSMTLHKDGGMNTSFRESLYKKDGLAPEILDALQSAGQVDIDTQKEVDMMSEENYNELVGAILKDHRVGSKILGNWYANTEGQRQFDKGKKKRKVDNKNPDGGMDMYFSPNQMWGSSGQTIGGGTLNTMLMKLHKGKYEIGGKMLNQQDDGSWLSSDGSTSMSGDELLQTLQDATNTNFQFMNDYRFNMFRGSDKNETLTPKSKQEMVFEGFVGNDGKTKLRNNIFDQNEENALPIIQDILGDKYRIDEKGFGYDALRIRTIGGDDVKIVKVEKVDGEYVPSTNSAGEYIYKNRIHTDFRESNLDRKTQEMMSLYYTFADENSLYHNPEIFKQGGQSGTGTFPAPTKEGDN